MKKLIIGTTLLISCMAFANTEYDVLVLNEFSKQNINVTSEQLKGMCVGYNQEADDVYVCRYEEPVEGPSVDGVVSSLEGFWVFEVTVQKTPQTPNQSNITVQTDEYFENL